VKMKTRVRQSQGEEAKSVIARAPTVLKKGSARRGLGKEPDTKRTADKQGRGKWGRLSGVRVERDGLGIKGDLPTGRQEGEGREKKARGGWNSERKEKRGRVCLEGRERPVKPKSLGRDGGRGVLQTDHGGRKKGDPTKKRKFCKGGGGRRGVTTNRGKKTGGIGA